MGTRPRLPSNVIWGLEDARAGVRTMWDRLAVASTRAEVKEDVQVLAAVNECMGELATVEHHLRNARAGKYEPRTRRVK
jgi:hypothetical protein